MKLFTSILLSLFLVAVAVSSIAAQNASSGFRVLSANGLADSEDIQINRVSPNNVYFGSSFSYTITGDANFDENFLFNANLLYNLQFDGTDWNFPIFGNVSLPSDNTGLGESEIGVFPWKVVSNETSKFITVLHGGIAYKVIPEDEVNVSPQEFELSVGVEFTLPLRLSSDGPSLPLTLSVVPTYSFLNLDAGNLFGLDSTFIFPISPNMGIIGDLQVPFRNGINPTFSAGVLTNGAVSNW